MKLSRRSIVVLIFFALVLIVLLYISYRCIYTKPSSYNLKRLYNEQIQFEFSYTKTLPGSNSVSFTHSFPATPAVFGTVVNQTNGSSSYRDSVLSISNITLNSFTPQVYKTWPVMGINWVACQKYIGKNMEVNFITNPQDLLGALFPDYDPYSDDDPVVPDSNIITFSSTFDDVPIVILSALHNGRNIASAEFGVYNVTKTGFQVTWNDSFDFSDVWPDMICYMAIYQPTPTSHSSFILETGCTDYGVVPSDGHGWDGYVKLSGSYQYNPVILSTVCYDRGYDHSYTRNGHMNATVDSISRQSFHVAINDNAWPLNGRINWISLVDISEHTSDMYPISMLSDYIVFEPSKTSDENSHVIEFDSDHQSEYADSCIIANGLGTLRTKSENGNIDPDLPLVNIINLTKDSMVCKINDTGEWPKGGLRYIRFSRNPVSKIDQYDQTYIIDFGIVDRDMFSSTEKTCRVPFNFDFPVAPKVLTSYHGFVDLKASSTIAVTSVFPDHFVFSPTFKEPYDKLFIPKYNVHWVAIYENPNATKRAFPYQIELHEFSTLNQIINTLPHKQPDNFSPLNDIFGLIPFQNEIPIEPSIVMGCSLLNMDTIHNTYLHVNTCFHKEFIEQILPPSAPVVWLLFVDPSVKARMPFSNCEDTDFIDPKCPTLTSNVTRCDSISVVGYLPLNQYEYLERITNLPANPYSLLTDISYPPVEMDDIVICNIHVSYNTRTAWSQYGEVCSNSANHLPGDNHSTYFTAWNVNTDYGYFSSCKSFGSILIRINSSFPSDKVIDLKFSGYGVSPNNKYYVQFGTGSDMVQGPFGYDETVQMQFGHPGCGAANVYCKIRKLFKNSCKGIVTPFLKSPENWIEGQACRAFLFPAVTGVCVGMAGGPEDVIADGVCPAFVGYPASIACSAYINDAKQAGDINRLLDYDRWASYICDKI